MYLVFVQLLCVLSGTNGSATGYFAWNNNEVKYSLYEYEVFTVGLSPIMHIIRHHLAFKHEVPTRASTAVMHEVRLPGGAI